MERFDLYDRDRRLTGITARRGDPIPPDSYRLAIHVCLFGEDGISKIYGMNIKDARAILVKAVAQLGDAEPDADYWKACDGNAKKALIGLTELTDRALSDYPDDEMFWEGD